MEKTRSPNLALSFSWAVFHLVLSLWFLLLGGIHVAVSDGSDFMMMPVDLAPVPCSDPAVGKLSRLAVTYINEDRDDGYKFALNRVANVHLHAQGPAGNVYYLDLDVLETKCHTGSPKPWKRCEVRPFMETQVSGNCNTTILHTSEGFSFLYSYDCFLLPDPPEKLQQTCPTCPTLLSVDHPDAMTAAQLAIAVYQRGSGAGGPRRLLGVKRITRAAVQARPVKAHFVEFTVQECPEGITPRGTCERHTLQSDTQTAGFCTGSVHGDLNFNPEAQVSCEMFKAQNVDLVRPVEPQGHDFLLPPEPSTPAGPSAPPSPPAVQPVPLDPVPVDPLPVDPAPIDLIPVEPVPVDPVPIDPILPSAGVSLSPPLTSSSSESDESREVYRPRPPVGAAPLDSSSEEVLGVVALRPPLDFRYKRLGTRGRRQALTEAPPPHNPVFLADFPSGSSPFRSCPGPSRYTTV